MSAAHKTARTAPFVREFTNSPWTGSQNGNYTEGDWTAEALRNVDGSASSCGALPNRSDLMTSKRKSMAQISDAARPPPVRVKLQRLNAT